MSERAADAAQTAWTILLRLTQEEQRDLSMATAVFAQLGMTLYAAGRTNAALDAFEYGPAEAPTEGYPHGFANLSMLAGIHALRGELSTAHEYMTLAREGDWPGLLTSTYSGTFYRIAEALATIERFDAACAHAHLEAMIHDRRTIEFWIEIASTEALVDLVDGRPGVGDARMHAFMLLRKGQGRSAGARARLAPVRALLRLALGNPETADALLQRQAAPGYTRSIGLARVHARTHRSRLRGHGSARRG